MAVPTTTKSVMAKTQSELKDVQIVPKDKMRGFDDMEDEDDAKPVKKAEPRKPVITETIIRKKSAKPAADLDDDDLDKIFSELDVIKELDENEISIDEDDDASNSFDDDDDLDMIADDEPGDYDDGDDED
jgi:hypothetical protein